MSRLEHFAAGTTSGHPFARMRMTPDDPDPFGHGLEHVQTMQAMHAETGKRVGVLSWYAGHPAHPNGEIADVWVHRDHQRQGVASHMLSMARRVNPNVHHSDALSDEAVAWAKARP